MDAQTRVARAFVAAPIVTATIVCSIFLVANPIMGALMIFFGALISYFVLLTIGAIAHIILVKNNAVGKWNYVLTSAAIGILLSFAAHTSGYDFVSLSSLMGRLHDRIGNIVFVEIWSVVIGWVFWRIARPDKP
mgnify:CR=1 FL=1|jgi:hypothetical protein